MSTKKFLHKLFSFLLTVVLVASTMPFGMLDATAASAKFAGGSGTESDPYLIETKEHLNNVRTKIYAHYKMISNIIFEDSDFEEGGAFFNNGLGWEPIAPTMYSFGGTFDGNNYVIQGLKINASEPTSKETGYGLFGGISGATIKNLKMTKTSINVNNNHYIYAGCISGYVYNSTISNCLVEGTITAKNSSESCFLYAGGILGNGCISSIFNTESNVNIIAEGNDRIGGICGHMSSGTILNVTNRGNLQGTTASGGIAGEASNTYIEGCNNYGTLNNIHPSESINGSSDCGGIVAWVLGETQIILCSNYGKISSYSTKEYASAAAGIVADMMSDKGDNAIISRCYNSGEISAQGAVGSNAGGIAGTFYFSTISDCFNVGKICSEFNAGGVTGFSQGSTILDCYNTGFISAQNVGGIVGENVSSNAIFCYYLDESIAETTNTDGIAQNSDQLKNINTYVSWDFDEIWTMEGRTDYFYPELINNPLVLCEESNSHKHSYSTLLTIPTCSKKGYTTYTCNCGYIYFDNLVDATGHNYTSTITTPATHTSTGVMTYTCHCGDTHTEKIDKIAIHNHISVVTEPTCTKKGYTTYTCECGDTYVTDYVDERGHDYKFEITTPATHISTGVMTFTCHCGDTYTETIVKIAKHNHNAVVTAPTCTEQGYTTYTCECGDSYVDDYVPEKGHDEGIWSVTKPSTPTESGVMHLFCGECGFVLETKVIPALGKVKSVSVSDVALDYKASTTITPSITVDSGVKYTVTYSSSDPSVASIDANGKVVAGKTGSATITVTVTDEFGNTVSDTCTVKVNYNWWQWIIVIVLFGWIWY